MILSLLGGALLTGVGLGAWFWLTDDLPRIERLADYRPPAVTQVLARDGSLMAEYFRQRRYVVPINEVPPLVTRAFVAAEDGDFFRHQGVDLTSVIRAGIANLRAGRVVQGGSTITQQVARGLLLTPEKTLVRKLKEMILAYRMEKYLAKEEILYLYLNQIYLGHGAYGVQAAALTYFGKNARDLEMAEGALLAGLVQAPSRYSPLRHPRRARTRQLYVIERLQAEGYIDQAAAEKARNYPLEVKLHRLPTVGADYYTEAVRQWLEERFGANTLYEGGLTVHTACDPKMTQEAQAAIALGLGQLTRRQGFRGPSSTLPPQSLAAVRAKAVNNQGLGQGQEMDGVVTDLTPQGVEVRLGSARGWLDPEDQKWAASTAYRYNRKKESFLVPGDVIRVKALELSPDGKGWRLGLVQAPEAQSAVLAIENRTGLVRVLVGGRDYALSQFNRALQAKRQPGSAFKPFIYAAALDHPVQAYTASSVIVDAPVVFDDPSSPGEKWKPKNYENRFYGPTTLRTALEHSRNVVTVKLLSRLGLPYTIDYARRFGFTGEMQPNLSLALGSCNLSLLEITRAYTVFANQGLLLEPILVERVLDREGKAVFESQTVAKQAISAQTAYLMTHMLRGVVEHGTGRRMQALARPVAGKTGTTNDLRDAWFLGFTPSLTCGVWVGQDDNQPLGRRETGARAAGPIWLDFMQHALKGKPVEDFTVSSGVVFTRVDPATGQAVPTGHAGGFFEAFRQGTEPTLAEAGAEGPGPAGAEDFLQADTFAPGQFPKVGEDQ